MTWLLLAALLAYVLLDATAQGKFAWLSREFIPPSTQPKVSLVLHWLCPLLFCIAAGIAAGLTKEPRWLLLAGLLRLALFDPVFSWSRGDKLFSLGSSAWLDRLLSRVPYGSSVVRVLALLGVVFTARLLFS